jgi:hypothetical protein
LWGINKIKSLIETLLPFIDRTKVSDTFLHTITEDHLSMEKEQMKQLFWDLIEVDESMINKGLLVDNEFDKYWNETFKLE